jgi:hypothetical protein
MEDEKRVHHDAHFQKELDFLKDNMAHIASLLKQMLKKSIVKASPIGL